jgi:hypothetical protein
MTILGSKTLMQSMLVDRVLGVILSRCLIDQCLIKYEAWLTEKLASDPHFLDPLRGKDLVCFCPLNQSCHADIIMRFLNEVPCIVEQSFGCLDKYFPEKPTAAQKRDFEKIVFG